MPDMVIVHVPRITSRLKYTFKLVMNDLLHCEVKLCTDISEFNSFSGVKFNYGTVHSSSELHFQACDLLFETGIGLSHIQCSEYRGIKTLFPVYLPSAALPYDPFAAIFYMVSRYEEYMPYMKDRYGRFTAFESIAFKEGFLHRPVVHWWAKHVGNILEAAFPGFKVKKGKFRFLPTYDIDQAWAFKNKGIIRNGGAIFDLALRGKFSDLSYRLNVITGRLPDPFDTYEYQLALQKEYQLKPLYFILFARYTQYDHNIPIYNARFRQLIKSLADYASIGIHPSYASNQDPDLFRQEVKNLSGVLNREISHSRQHFLKLHLPETYRQLALMDITHDYTMGFAAKPGFRAGICIPYRFYDLDLETETPVTVVPFQVMDGTLKDYMNLGPNEASDLIVSLIDEVKAVDGLFVSLWHNESLSETDRWVGWKTVYENLVRKAAI